MSADSGMSIDLGMSNVIDKNRFRELFGDVYEHSPWLADAVFDSVVKSPIVEDHGQVEKVRGDTARVEMAGVDIARICERLIARFEQVFLASSEEQQLAVLKAHPELACQRATNEQLTAASQSEQSGSGLDQCSDSQFIQFRDMNNKYMNKNNFPFIVAVKGLNRSDILQIFKKRLANHSEAEFELALRQVNRIARFRIEAILHA